MFELKFDTFNLQITDFAVDGNLFAIDIHFPSKEYLKKFSVFYSNHIQDEYSFDYVLNGTMYHGRFGMLVYDIDFNARFYMTTVPNDYILHSSAHVLEYNLLEILTEHEKRISTLVNILFEKNLLNDDDLSKLVSVFGASESEIDFSHKVKNLDDFLLKNGSTLNEIRNDSK